MRVASRRRLEGLRCREWHQSHMLARRSPSNGSCIRWIILRSASIITNFVACLAQRIGGLFAPCPTTQPIPTEIQVQEFLVHVTARNPGPHEKPDVAVVNTPIGKPALPKRSRSSPPASCAQALLTHFGTG